jgi:hypothetical protein
MVHIVWIDGDQVTKVQQDFDFTLQTSKHVGVTHI